VANGVVYVGPEDGNLYAFNLTGNNSAPPVALRPNPASLHPNLRLKVHWQRRL